MWLACAGISLAAMSLALAIGVDVLALSVQAWKRQKLLSRGGAPPPNEALARWAE